MRRLIWALVLGILAILLAGGCRRSNEVWNAMVEFDQAFIPVLALTNQQQKAAAEALAPRMLTRWEVFQQSVRHSWGDIEPWQRIAPEVTQRLAQAGLLIRENRLAEAHENLEQVRDLLLEQRRARGIDYFPDYLTAYHAPMENMILFAEDLTPATLTQANIDELQQKAREAQGLWRQVEQFPFERQRYQLSAAKASVLQQDIMKENKALENLLAALSNGDRANILKAVPALKPPLAEAYMLFGDFPPTPR
jgi:hypothetical protein